MNYTFHPHAEKELEQIEIYYDSELEGLGDRFRDEIQLTISRVLEFPNGWPALSKNVRRCRLNRFPYGIVYQVIPGKVFILAVMHDRREPYYWAYRT
jgi:plasmid stabilization system protein ParE